MDGRPNLAVRTAIGHPEDCIWNSFEVLQEANSTDADKDGAEKTLARSIEKQQHPSGIRTLVSFVCRVEGCSAECEVEFTKVGEMISMPSGNPVSPFNCIQLVRQSIANDL